MATTKAQKIRLGLFGVTAVAAAAVVLVVWAGLRFWEQHDRYVIYFDESVIGLEEGAAVSFAGIIVGKVEKIEVAPDDLRKVKVTIEVKTGLPIRTDTTAILRFAGITGLKVIDLHGGEVGAPRLQPGATIATGVTVLDRFEKQAEDLVAQSKQIMDNANKVMGNLATITDPAQFAGMSEVVAHARTTSANLAATSAELQAMVSENRVAVRRTVASVDHITQRATELVDADLPRVIGGAGTLVEDMRGVVRDNQSYLRSAMFDLRQASRSFKDLARDLRQRPSRLFFSSAAQERKLP